MGRKSREKRERRSSKTSTLSQHKKEGSRFVPPLAQVPSLSPSSWLDDRLPELLWGALLLKQFPRDAALEVFRTLGDRVAKSVSTYDVRLSGIAAAFHPLPAATSAFSVIRNLVCQSNTGRCQHDTDTDLTIPCRSSLYLHDPAHVCDMVMVSPGRRASL